MKGLILWTIGTIVFLMMLSIGTVAAGTFGRYIEDDYDYDADCPGEDLDIAGMTADWYTEMLTTGYTGHSSINTANLLWAADPNLLSGGQDTSYLELYDIRIMGMHGNFATSGGVVQYRMTWNEDRNGTCRLWPRTQMDLGEGSGDDIEILHMISCHSMTTQDNI